MIVKTKTGLKHFARESWFYTGSVAETGIVPNAPKRGRGRPSSKDSAFASASFAGLEAAFGMKMPKKKYKGPSRVVLKVDINGTKGE
jgi:hypothetical protein